MAHESLRFRGNSTCKLYCQGNPKYVKACGLAVAAFLDEEDFFVTGNRWDLIVPTAKHPGWRRWGWSLDRFPEGHYKHSL